MQTSGLFRAVSASGFVQVCALVPKDFPVFMGLIYVANLTYPNLTCYKFLIVHSNT